MIKIIATTISSSISEKPRSGGVTARYSGFLLGSNFV